MYNYRRAKRRRQYDLRDDNTAVGVSLTRKSYCHRRFARRVLCKTKRRRQNYCHRRLFCCVSISRHNKTKRPRQYDRRKADDRRTSHIVVGARGWCFDLLHLVMPRQEATKRKAPSSSADDNNIVVSNLLCWSRDTTKQRRRQYDRGKPTTDAQVILSSALYDGASFCCFSSWHDETQQNKVPWCDSRRSFCYVLLMATRLNRKTAGQGPRRKLNVVWAGMASVYTYSTVHCYS